MFSEKMWKEMEEKHQTEERVKEKVREEVVRRGEGGPEDKGAQGRFEERKEKTPAAPLAFWWFMHNCVAHPLIGVLPFKPLFDFHDWTAKKIGSEVLMRSL